jgi:hypothetical protein
MNMSKIKKIIINFKSGLMVFFQILMPFLLWKAYPMHPNIVMLIIGVYFCLLFQGLYLLLDKLDIVMYRTDIIEKIARQDDLTALEATCLGLYEMGDLTVESLSKFTTDNKIKELCQDIIDADLQNNNAKYVDGKNALDNYLKDKKIYLKNKYGI